jgi:hypothetical protein
MVTHLIPNSKYVTITQYGAAGMPSVTRQNNSELVGTVRYDTDQGCLKVFNGINWHFIPAHSTANIGLTPEADQLLDWAKRKQQEELEFERQAKDNPAVQDLINQIKEKQNQLKMVQALIQKEVTLE